MEPLRDAPLAQSFSAARTVRAESDDVHMSQRNELPENGWRVPEQVTIHVLESPDDLADFLTAIHIREMAESSAHKIAGILRLIGTPVTVICEHEYADALYRDTFYACFSRKFSVFPRDCKRLSFFQGELNPTDCYRYASETERLLQERFVGICILKPIRYGEIGRTVLDPLKLKIPVCYVKTARFRMDVLGHALFVDGYPYSSQDTETMTCAEITIWSIMEYFGVSFPEYGTVLPSQITAGLDKLSSERTLPSRGSEYTWMSALFKKFGFAPRLYDRRAFSGDTEQEKEFRKLFHYYVESGIPLAVGISGRKRGEELYHSVVCIGHSDKQKPVKTAEIGFLGGDTIYPFIDSAFLREEYVIIDDNQIPYQVERLDRLTGWDKVEVSTFAVPLHRDVFLDAGDVAAIVSTVFEDESLGIARLVPEFGESVDLNNPLILRVFLAPDDAYRRFRASHAKEPTAAAFYAALRLPRFVWVAEISTYRAYLNRQIYGEIVIDATAGRNSSLDSLILVRYLNRLGFRTPEQSSIYSIDDGLKRRTLDLQFPFAMYGDNLTQCGGDENL